MIKGVAFIVPVFLEVDNEDLGMGDRSRDGQYSFVVQFVALLFAEDGKEAKSERGRRMMRLKGLKEFEEVVR